MSELASLEKSLLDLLSLLDSNSFPIILGGGYGLYCLLYTSPSPRDQRGSRMPSSA